MHCLDRHTVALNGFEMTGFCPLNGVSRLQSRNRAELWNNRAESEIDPGFLDLLGFWQAVPPVMLRRVRHQEQTASLEPKRNRLLGPFVLETKLPFGAEAQ